MADLIPNLAERWPAAPDWPAATLEGADVTVRSVAGLYQMLVSGDLDAWNRASGLDGPGLGVLAQAKGKAKAWQVRVARDRLLAVSEKPFSIEPGWHGEGFAVTRMDAALHVFEVEGEGLAGVIARATTVDPSGKSSSAALLFAGVNAIAYRYAAASRLRVHVDRSLTAYLWEWLETAVGVTPTRP
jgi:hypothetical protein